MINFNEKYDKNILEKLIFVDKLSYKEIGRLYKVSDTYIKKVAKKLDIILPVRSKFKEDYKPINKGKGRKIVCLYCNKEVNPSLNNQIFCGLKCNSEHKKKEYYKYYLSNQEEFCDVNRDLKPLKKHILKDQNNCCLICGINDIWNNKPLNFVLDHIDGDASNNLRINLRLVCHNCDSQLDTYKSKNKNSARKERYIKNYKN